MGTNAVGIYLCRKLPPRIRFHKSYCELQRINKHLPCQSRFGHIIEINLECKSSLTREICIRGFRRSIIRRMVTRLAKSFVEDEEGERFAVICFRIGDVELGPDKFKFYVCTWDERPKGSSWRFGIAVELQTIALEFGGRVRTHELVRSIWTGLSCYCQKPRFHCCWWHQRVGWGEWEELQKRYVEAG